MKSPFPFELEDEFWEETLEQLRQQTGNDREQIRRGLTYMVGRRAGRLLQSLTEEDNDALIWELEIAILHSGEEK